MKITLKEWAIANSDEKGMIDINRIYNEKDQRMEKGHCPWCDGTMPEYGYVNKFTPHLGIFCSPACESADLHYYCDIEGK